MAPTCTDAVTQLSWMEADASFAAIAEPGDGYEQRAPRLYPPPPAIAPGDAPSQVRRTRCSARLEWAEPFNLAPQPPTPTSRSSRPNYKGYLLRCNPQDALMKRDVTLPPLACHSRSGWAGQQPQKISIVRCQKSQSSRS